VFSTLHTNMRGHDHPSVDMGIENYLLASTMRGVLAQRLRAGCANAAQRGTTTRSIGRR
jgi:type II secretory ATPase GspE/PulE/Tfp pilus assembly ATPase PilB-like protein